MNITLSATRRGFSMSVTWAAFKLIGKGALAYLQRVTTNDVEKISLLNSQYSMICNQEGGVKDDIFIYRLAEEKFLLCVNASNREKIFNWLQHQRKKQALSIKIEDQSESLVHNLPYKVQLPTAIIKQELGEEIDRLKPRQCAELKLSGVSTLITRTGYTGERGYELYLPSDQAVEVWEKIMAIGKTTWIKTSGSRG